MLHAQLAATGARVNAWFIQWLRVVGSPNPDRDMRIVANYVTGLVLHESAHPTDTFDPTQTLRRLDGAGCGRPPRAWAPVVGTGEASVGLCRAGFRMNTFIADSARR